MEALVLLMFLIYNQRQEHQTPVAAAEVVVAAAKWDSAALVL
jgi:hypothetical protein